jgi:hypothetical protein
MNAQLFAATMLGHSAFRDSKITITLEEHKEMLDDFRRNGWKNRVTRLSKSAINTITECHALIHVTPVDFSEYLGLAPVTRLLYPNS